MDSDTTKGNENITPYLYTYRCCNYIELKITIFNCWRLGPNQEPKELTDMFSHLMFDF